MLPGISPLKAALLSAAFLFAALSGCAAPGSIGGADRIAAWATEHGFSATTIRVDAFRLAAFVRKSSLPVDSLSIYIEGDGAAWVTPYHPPRDPTPHQPIALELAAADTSATVIYLGRPCQYLDARALQDCDSAYWTERRFAPEVVVAYDAAISQQKSALAARRLRLIGYSGGGVLATLLAARRDDVELLITVAAPLAVADWVATHNASALTGSLDPAELEQNARLPRSVHFAGGNDRIVPESVVKGFVRRKGGQMETIPDFDHECCWVRDWDTLLMRVTDREKVK